MMREMKSTTTQALYATLLIQDKLASALFDSGSSVSMITWNFLQSLGFIGALGVYKGKILTVNSSSMPLQGKAEFILQINKLAPEFRAAFLISTVETFQRLLVSHFVIGNDCILYAEEKTLRWEDMPKTIIESNTKYQWVNVLDISFNTSGSASSEKLLQCEIGSKDDSEIYSNEGMVTLNIEPLKNSNGLLVAQNLIKDGKGNCWVRSLKIHYESIVT